MEKSRNYPQMPPDMAAADGMRSSGNQPPAPPSYEQATNSTSFLPTQEPAQVYVGPGLGFSSNSTYPQQTTYAHTTGAVPTYHRPTAAPPPPVGGQQPPVVIIQQAILALGPEPAYVTCPYCHIQKLTRIEYAPSSRTHLMAALLCLLGFWCCVCLPYCAGSCMNADHYCGNCNKFLGTYGGGI